MLDKAFGLVLLAALLVFVAQAIGGIAAVLTVLLAAFGLMQTRHDSTSIGRNALYVLIMMTSCLFELALCVGVEPTFTGLEAVVLPLN